MEELKRGAATFGPGFAAGLVTLLVGQPFDTIKVRLQTHTGTPGFIGSLQECLNKEGVQGLYKGHLTLRCLLLRASTLTLHVRDVSSDHRHYCSTWRALWGLQYCER